VAQEVLRNAIITFTLAKDKCIALAYFKGVKD
jgi:hypothetical protein